LAVFHDRGEDLTVRIRNDFGPPEEIRASEVMWRGTGGRYLARLASVVDHAAGEDRSVSKTLS